MSQQYAMLGSRTVGPVLRVPMRYNFGAHAKPYRIKPSALAGAPPPLTPPPVLLCAFYIVVPACAEVIDAFISENVDAFIGCEDTQVSGEDNKLEYWTVYQEFVKLFEAKLGEFLAEEDSTPAEFYRVCKAVSNSGNDWGDDATFINLLVATSDYGAFLGLMKEEAAEAAEIREREARKKAEAAEREEASEGKGGEAADEGDAGARGSHK